MVSDKNFEIVETIPGWYHDVKNIGNEELIVMLWANEIFNPDTPDTMDKFGFDYETKLDIAIVVGTRPEIIRLSRVISVLDKTNLTLIHTGQNHDYELNEIFFKDLKIKKPDYFLNAARDNAAETIGKTIIETDKILQKIKPDALLVLGDTNSCLSVIPAKKRKIPIFHMEAGNRCFDQRVPEETNRRIVDHVADINLRTAQ